VQRTNAAPTLRGTGLYTTYLLWLSAWTLLQRRAAPSAGRKQGCEPTEHQGRVAVAGANCWICCLGEVHGRIVTLFTGIACFNCYFV
jgi:hypothetical protein